MDGLLIPLERLSQELANIVWAMMKLGHLEGGKRVVEAVAIPAIEAFKTDLVLQNQVQCVILLVWEDPRVHTQVEPYLHLADPQGNFGWSLIGLTPERTDLLAQVCKGYALGFALGCAWRIPLTGLLF